MVLEALQCIRCGAPLKTRTEDGYKCDHCRMTYKSDVGTKVALAFFTILDTPPRAGRQILTSSAIGLGNVLAAIRKHRGRLLEDDEE